MIIKTLKFIFNAVFVMALLLVVTLFFSQYIPFVDDFEVKIVKSGSMEPAIKTGGIVIIGKSGGYKVGDVITFGEDSKNSIPTTHRIVSMREANGAVFYETKGDANPKPDPQEIEKGSIIGKVVFTVPYAGYVLDFARQPLGFALLIAVPAGLLIIYEIMSICGEISRMRNKRRMSRDSRSDRLVDSFRPRNNR